MRDEWFIRGKIPMTKSEVRTVSLSKLELYEGCEFWDIGAGTGSVSVEAAVSCPGIHVCAFEYKEEAVDLIRANCEKARTEAVTIVPGKAPETFAQVSVHRPDRAFIGEQPDRCARFWMNCSTPGRYPDCDQPDCAGVSDSAYELPERARDRGGDSVHADCKSGEDWFQSFDERGRIRSISYHWRK